MVGADAVCPALYPTRHVEVHPAGVPAGSDDVVARRDVVGTGAGRSCRGPRHAHTRVVPRRLALDPRLQQSIQLQHVVVGLLVERERGKLDNGSAGNRTAFRLEDCETNQRAIEGRFQNERRRRAAHGGRRSGIEVSVARAGISAQATLEGPRRKGCAHGERHRRRYRHSADVVHCHGDDRVASDEDWRDADRVRWARRLSNLGASDVVLDTLDAVAIGGVRHQVECGRGRDIGTVCGRSDAHCWQRVAGRIGLYPSHRLVDPDVAVVGVLQADEDVVIRRVTPLAQHARSSSVARRSGRSRRGRCRALYRGPSGGRVTRRRRGQLPDDIGVAPKREPDADRIVLQRAELDVDAVCRHP